MSRITGWELKNTHTCHSCVVLVSGPGAQQQQQQQLQQQQNNIFSGPRHTHWLNRASGRNDYWGHIQVVVQDSDHRYWRCILWGTTCRLTRRVIFTTISRYLYLSLYLWAFFFSISISATITLLHKHDALVLTDNATWNALQISQKDPLRDPALEFKRLGSSFNDI